MSYNIAYSYDGSGHDAHQHAPLIDTVDNQFIDRYLDLFLQV